MRRLMPETLDVPARPVRLGAAASPVLQPVERADDMERRLQEAFDDARDRGFDAGMKDAGREVERRVEKVAERLERDHAGKMRSLQERENALRRLSEGLADAVAGLGRELEAASVEVAYVALARVLGARAAERELVQAHCLAVVHEFGDSTAVLRVSEQDLGLLDPVALSLPVESDRALTPGQCVIETAKGQFDCGLDTRLEAIRQALLAGLREHRVNAP